ncbi:DNA (cytosine-5-)-methyltransferase, partial [Kosakonia sacchari]
MAEFDSLAQDLLAQAETDQQRQQERDRVLLDQVLEIYGQKYVAEQLKKAGKAEWSRESLNRWVNGKGNPRTFTAAEEAQL